MFAVASSSSTILLLLKMARHIQSNCFSPALKFSPPCETWNLSPLSLSLLSRLPRSAFCNSDKISSSVLLFWGSMLKRRLPVNKVGSCGITVIFYRNKGRARSLMSSPSIIIEPLSSSTMRLNARQIVLFPAPVLPTMPTFWPYSALKERPLSTISVPGLYLKQTWSNAMLPFYGHPSGSFPSTFSY